MAEGREPLLQAGSSASTSFLLPMNSNRDESSAGAGSGSGSSSGSGSGHAERRPVSQGMDIPGLKKRRSGLRSVTRVDCWGIDQVIKMNKHTMLRRCNLPSRDLRFLDPIFVYPSTILGREKAIVVNLEQIRCIITAEEVLLINSYDIQAFDYVAALQRRLTAHSGDVLAGGGTSRDNLPFEFRALEVALEAACIILHAQAVGLENEAYPLLDEFTSKISTSILERVRRLKSKLVALTKRVQKVRDVIAHLMDDDNDMAEMCLTEKERRMESSFFGDQSLLGNSSSGADVAVPVPASSQPGSQKLGKTLISRSMHESMKSSDSTTEHVEGLEMLLEAYFVVIDSTLNKLTSLNEYINNTEDSINIQLDTARNQLIQCELILTTAMLVIAICGAVAGVFGMNFAVPLHKNPHAFKWVVIITLTVAAIIFFSLLWLYKSRKLLSHNHCCLWTV